MPLNDLWLQLLFGAVVKTSWRLLLNTVVVDIFLTMLQVFVGVVRFPCPRGCCGPLLVMRVHETANGIQRKFRRIGFGANSRQLEMLSLCF